MESSDLLNLILNQENYIKDTKYPLYLHSDLTSFATNIILVLEGGRLAYLPGFLDQNLQEYLIQLVLDREHNLMLFPYEHSPIILKENYEIVANILSNESNTQTALAKVLDYPYTGLKWQAAYRDAYIISYDLQDNIQLYAFSIPVEEYNDEMRVQILENTIKYQNILGKYGYEVILHSGFKAKGSGKNTKAIIPISLP